MLSLQLALTKVDERQQNLVVTGCFVYFTIGILHRCRNTGNESRDHE